jgi:hypothetical protein
MNFITHYAFDRKGPSSYFTLGVAIPDLLPLAGRHLRVPYRQLMNHAFEGHEAEEYWLLKGVLHHFYTDRVFHDSVFFQREREFILPFLHTLFDQNPNQRYFFLTHVFVEFYLDRVIQMTEVNLAEEFYKHFHETDFKQSAQYLGQFSGKPFDALVNHLEVFRDRQYLHAYREEEGFLYALNRTIKRTGIMSLETIHPERFHEVMMPYEVGLHKRLDQLFPEMQAGFKALGYSVAY